MGGFCYDGEPVKCYTEKDVRPRRARKCSDCDHEIQPRETCHSESYLFDGAWTRTYTCATCYALFRFLWDNEAECLHIGFLSEYVGEIAPHEWLAGGEFEGYPKGFKYLDALVARAQKERDEDEAAYGETLPPAP